MARPRTLDAERICQAAAALLAAEGPDRITVAAVARAAGVSPGTVYNYFRNKEHLLAAAGDRPGARSAWYAPEPGEAGEAYLRRLAGAALGRFRLLASGGAAGIKAECDALVPLLAARIGPERAQAFYLALAGASLLGEPPEGDRDFAGTIARLLAG